MFKFIQRFVPKSIALNLFSKTADIGLWKEQGGSVEAINGIQKMVERARNSIEPRTWHLMSSVCLMSGILLLLGGIWSNMYFSLCVPSFMLMGLSILLSEA
jgi:hypothetical protein